MINIIVYVCNIALTNELENFYDVIVDFIHVSVK